jgi:hypothetical protein
MTAVEARPTAVSFSVPSAISTTTAAMLRNRP